MRFLYKVTLVGGRELQSSDPGVRSTGNRMWIVFTILMVLWILLKFVLGKGGYIHMIVVAAISIAVVQLIAQRKNRYHEGSDN